jgi:gluconolactonase
VGYRDLRTILLFAPCGRHLAHKTRRRDNGFGPGLVPDPNGLLFSPDYKKLYVISTGKGPGDTGPGGKGDMHVFDVGPDNKLSNRKLFTDFMIDGVKCAPDGARCDVDGNLWCSSSAGRAFGYSGVTV